MATAHVEVAVSKQTIVSVFLGVPIWLVANVAFGQTIADTLTDEERTIGDVVYTSDQMASLEGTTPGVYEAFLADQWRSRNGFEKYRLVVSQLYEYWGVKERSGLPALLNRVDDTATDEQRSTLQAVFDRASATLLQTHLASEQVRNALQKSFDGLLKIVATVSESEAESFEACMEITKTTEHGCLGNNQRTFDNGIDECIGDASGGASASPILGPCALSKHQGLSDGFASCLIDFSNESRRCLTEIDWPATQ